MHRLFTIDHIVHEICSYITNSQLPVLARVSSIWFRCAISHLYKTVAVYEALAPLGKMYEKDCLNFQKTFVTSPRDEDFKRLEIYRPYVRYLYVDADSSSITLEAMRKKVFRSNPYLFPNTRVLILLYPEYSPESMEISLGLVSPEIRQLSIYIHGDPMFHYICQLVMTRLPALQFLVISDETPTADDGEESCLAKPVQDLLTCFTHTLSSVGLSLCLSTPSIVKCLSKMPNLCNLAIKYCVEDEFGTDLRGSSNGGNGSSDFPSLSFFSFDGLSQSLQDMFLEPYGLASLTTLCLSNVDLMPDDVRISASSIATACPRIESLTFGNKFLYGDALTRVWPVVPWSFIQPISCCKELANLSFYHMHISVNPKELTEFIKSRTTWTRVHILTLKPLPLQATMLLYAENCPKLEHLGIHLNCRLRLKDLPNELPSFSNLDSIDFGRSHISESASRSLAQLLCRICKNPPTQFHGLDGEMMDNLLRNIANSYLDEQCRHGGPMSSKVRDFVKMVVKKRMPIDT